MTHTAGMPTDSELLAKAVRLGFLTSPGVCGDCLGPGDVHPHLRGEPLRLATGVIWLCDRCALRRRQLDVGATAPLVMRVLAFQEEERRRALGLAGFDARYCQACWLRG